MKKIVIIEKNSKKNFIIKKIVIIEKSCDNWKKLWLKRLMLVIRWIQYEVIRTVLKSLFFYKKILHAQKAQKAPKAPKTPEAQKAQKGQKNVNKRINAFSPWDVFYGHKNTTFFVFVRLYVFSCLIKM